ncbi:AraC family transcriptional regulator [Ciceribacter sp. L1K23]|uniref:AraC family transcriptional regulator n=1 Tax=Ciceribacter sp. L1K23 TaxID=2820276 RepID=UPI001B821D4B|nr:helix-turn-helix domain-containing protein [Ciceribacter sp. L1K23]MBR0556929.1 AraC family transcriptional regulator [Ciceribacter sp. L1K23]
MDERAWIMETPDDREEQYFDGGGVMNFDHGPFRGFMEKRLLRPGINLYRVSATSDRDWSMTPDGDAPAGHLVLGTMLSGAGTLEAAGNERRIWRGGGRPFAVSLAERQITYNVGAGEQWSAVTLLFEPATLEDLVSRDVVPPLVRAVLKDGRLPVSEVLDADRALARAAQEIFNAPYRGTMMNLWRESKALEMLACHLDRLGGEEPQRAALTTRELQRVREVHELLLSDLRTPPSLQVLATAVRMSPRRLNQCFRLVHGATVFEALLEARMQAARHMVRECPEVPLKTLAWQVGYNQLSNFINAYRRRFGVSPGQHRRMSES